MPDVVNDGGMLICQIGSTAEPAQPCVLVIFGATGDLAARKLIPAVYNLAADRLLPDGTIVVGVGRRDWDDRRFRDEMFRSLQQHSRQRPTSKSWQQFARRLYYCRLQLDDRASYRLLAQRLGELERPDQTGGRRLFYLASLPELVGPIAAGLAEAGLGDQGGRQDWRRLVVEKPFGQDQATARVLNQQITAGFAESQIYRIDHYLGKQTVQNLLVLRFANGLFEPFWNRQHIDHVQITVAESIGVGGRGRYYEQTGAVLDMLQNHLMQLLALVAMEVPGSLSAQAIQDERVKLLRAVRPMAPVTAARESVCGQYTAGQIDGQEVCGYRQEPNVAADSRRETFVATRLWIDNWRWSGVAFYLRTGKRLARKASQIVIQFHQAPAVLFRAFCPVSLQPYRLVLRLQPDEGLALQFNAKIPGTGTQIRPVAMDFRYDQQFGSYSPEAYERLLLDAMAGDRTLFLRPDELERAWQIVEPIQQVWQHGGGPAPYQAGTWGPACAEQLLQADGRSWYQPDVAPLQAAECTRH
ncbi:MAG: glucose-6-phosphate dehydrogenase [Phycisphaerae bacterium]